MSESCAAGGSWVDGGYDVSSDASCASSGPGDIVEGSGLTAELGQLQGNGGPLDSIGLLVPNPAAGIVPHGSSAGGVTLCPTTDERGVTAGGGACDAGAVQDVLTAGNGTGTLTVSPDSSIEGAAGAYQLTYTAATSGPRDYAGAPAGGIDGGTLEITVPSGWSPPSLAPGTAGEVLTSCAGALSVVGQQIVVSDLLEPGGASCSVDYGNTGAAAAVAPSVPASYSFLTLESSSASGDPSALGQSPAVTVSAPQPAATGPGGGSGGGSGRGGTSSGGGNSPGVVPVPPSILKALLRLGSRTLTYRRGIVYMKVVCLRAPCRATVTIDHVVTLSPHKPAKPAKPAKPGKGKLARPTAAGLPALGLPGRSGRAAATKTKTKTKRPRVRLVRLGVVTVRIGLGKHVTVRVKLDKTGRKLLAKVSRRHPVKNLEVVVRLSGTGTAATRVVAR